MGKRSGTLVLEFVQTDLRTGKSEKSRIRVIPDGKYSTGHVIITNQGGGKATLAPKFDSAHIVLDGKKEHVRDPNLNGRGLSESQDYSLNKGDVIDSYSFPAKFSVGSGFAIRNRIKVISF